MIGEFVEDLFHADHRVWRTLLPLLLKPGFLTNEYLRGRRVRYTPPFRLYIVLSLIFFLTASLQHTDVTVSIDRDADKSLAQPGAAGAPYALDADAKEQLEEFLERVGKDERQETRERIETALREIPQEQQSDVVIGMSNPCSPDALGRALPESLGSRQRLLDACRNMTGDNSGEFTRALGERIPQMMFFFLPLIALFAKTLYLGWRRYYAEHLLFFVHFHAFVFLILAINNVLGWLLGWFSGGWAGILAGLLTTAVVLYSPFYLYRAMRSVYRQGRWLTITKFVLMLGGYALNLLVAFILIAAFTAMTLPSH